MIEIEKALPDFRMKGDGNMVVVNVELDDGQTGKAFFGCSGAPGEPLEGHFWIPEYGQSRKVVSWSYLN